MLLKFRTVDGETISIDQSVTAFHILHGDDAVLALLRLKGQNREEAGRNDVIGHFLNDSFCRLAR